MRSSFTFPTFQKEKIHQNQAFSRHYSGNGVLIILTEKRNATTKIKVFIQAVISSNYVEINQQKILAVLFRMNLKLSAAVLSNWRKPRPQFDVTQTKFVFEFPEDLDTLKDKEGTR